MSETGYAVIMVAVLAALPALWALLRQRRSHKKALSQVRTDASDSLASLKGAHAAVLASLGHDLRGGLSAIATSVEILERTASTDVRGLQSLRIIRRQLDRLSNTLRRLNDNADAQATGSVYPVDLLAFVRGVAARLEPSLRGELRLEVSGSPVLADADPERMEQLLRMLLQVAQESAATRVRIMISEGVGSVDLLMTDDGQGLRDELLAQLHPAPSGKKADETNISGWGRDLQLAQHLARQQQGSLTVTSAGRGKGSSFFLQLPRVPAAGPSAHARESATDSSMAAGGTAPRRRILIVEDHADARESLQAMLEMDGHEVAVAADAVEALARFRLFSPEVVLVDIDLPGMNGYEWGRQIRSRYGQAARLVAVTGYDGSADRRRTVEAGFDKHLVKPVPYEELQAVLH